MASDRNLALNMGIGAVAGLFVAGPWGAVVGAAAMGAMEERSAVRHQIEALKKEQQKTVAAPAAPKEEAA